MKVQVCFEPLRKEYLQQRLTGKISFVCQQLAILAYFTPLESVALQDEIDIILKVATRADVGDSRYSGKWYNSKYGI